MRISDGQVEKIHRSVEEVLMARLGQGVYEAVSGQLKLETSAQRKALEDGLLHGIRQISGPIAQSIVGALMTPGL